jgi:hypothetical protein
MHLNEIRHWFAQNADFDKVPDIFLMCVYPCQTAGRSS